MRRALIQLQAVILKEVRQTVRDKRMMALIVVAPLLQLIVLGYAVNLDIDRVPTVVVDHDRSVSSRRHLQALLADGTLVEVARTHDEETAQRYLEEGSASVVLIIPPGFDRALGRGEPAQVQVVLDGTNPNRSAVAGAAVQRYIAQTAMAEGAALLAELPPIPSIDLATRVRYNPRLETAVFMVPGIAAVLLILITTIITSMGLAREREVGTLEQVMVTPLPPSVVILGKLIPFAVVGLVDFGLALTAGSYLFEVPLRGSLPFLFGVTALYLLSTLGTGLLISSASASQQQAFMLGFAIILPAILLSGIFTPVMAMPEWLQPVTYLNPVRYFAEVMRAVLLKSAGIEELWRQVLALAGFGTFFLVVSSMRFRKQMG
jgi:ABC-2 type transport system permease protein